ncbi:hypothetical protein WA158_006586 [Blastocystis sp. Blastoise]
MYTTHVIISKSLLVTRFHVTVDSVHHSIPVIMPGAIPLYSLDFANKKVMSAYNAVKKSTLKSLRIGKTNDNIEKENEEEVLQSITDQNTVPDQKENDSIQEDTAKDIDTIESSKETLSSQIPERYKDYTFGSLMYYKLNTTNNHFLEEINIDEPKEYFDSLPDKSDQRYEYMSYNVSIQSKQQYCRHSLGYYSFPRNKHFSFFSLPHIDKIENLFNPYFMVGMVKSPPLGVWVRKAIRETFASQRQWTTSDRNYKFYFVVALSMKDTEKLKMALLKEQAEYNDLIIPNILDSYQNVTMKVLMAEDLFITAKATTPYYMLTDDDTCLKMKDLMRQLDTAPRERYYIGQCVYNKIGGGPLKCKHDATREGFPRLINLTLANGMVLSNDVVYSHQKWFRRMPVLMHMDDSEIGIFNDLEGVKPICANYIMHYTKPDAEQKWFDGEYIGMHRVKTTKLMTHMCTDINL